MHRISSTQELEAIVGTANPAVRLKQVDALDDGCRRLLAASPVAGLGFRDEGGVPRTTLVGGRRGFVHVASPRRLELDLPPGRAPGPGSGASLVFLVPGLGETLRLNGSVVERGAGRVALAVEEAYVHCSRAILRSGLWRATSAGRAGRAGRAASATPAGGPGPLADPAVAGFLAQSPFAVVSSWDTRGTSDTSPRGDQAGFLRALDAHTLAIPDRRGNQRADTFHNLLSCDLVSLAAVVPGRDDVLHARGTAYATDDPALLATMVLDGKAPRLALVIRVEHAEVALSEAVRGSGMWRASAHVDPADVPDPVAISLRHLARSEQGGLQGAAVRLLGRVLGVFPSLVRRLSDAGMARVLADEGYGPAAGPGREAAREGALGGREVLVREVLRETADAVSLVLESAGAEPFHFRPGQFFTLLVEIDGETVRRAYSASSVPGLPQLTVTIKRVPGGRCSTFANERLRPGDRLRLLGPSGTFGIEDAAAAPPHLVLIAGGSGITPMMSIARAVLARSTGSRVTLLYGNRSEAETLFAAALAALEREHGERFTVRHVLESPPATWSGGTGRLDEATLGRELAPWLGPATHCFVCGPEPMMRGARRVLVGLGVADDRIHEERFSPPAPRERPAAGRPPARRLPMVVERRGRRLGAVEVAAGQSLLEAALESGLPMPFSCAMGSCGECRVLLRSGEVDTDEMGTLSPGERDRGFILACVARPRSAIVVEIEPPDDAR